MDPRLSMRLGHAIESGHLSSGPIGTELEEKLAALLEIPHVTLTTSGSTALLILYRILGLNENTEAILPTRTFQATANAATFLRAKVVPTEVDDRGLMSARHLEAAITSKTKVVVPVHLNGRACDMRELQRVAKSRGLFVIEDAAQALFSRGESGFCGTVADAGIFSLGVTKFLTSAQGGAIVTRNSGLHREIAKYLRHAVTFEPRERYSEFGFNFRLPDLSSALALAQLTELESSKERFLDVERRYRELLRGRTDLGLIECDLERGELPVWTEVLCPRRDDLVRHLDSLGIEARPFSPSLHECDYLGSEPNARFPNASLFAREGLILPCGPELEAEDFERVRVGLETFV
ncbi:MAG: aminotransferase class I/II-fold pyridoxal phosphate-dependent enzyme [Bdellovibrionota bacterium]